ncbi:MAG: hypothetical protein M1404_06780 [Acidobacteria bacterium]|nr:hypothetical protein [Acidobacteriota bacterium]
MSAVNRREFMQISASSLLLAGAGKDAIAAERPVRVSGDQKKMRAEGQTYLWEWSREDDLLRFSDSKGRVMAQGRMQPAVIVESAAPRGQRQCVSGRPTSFQYEANRAQITYEGVNGTGKLTVRWRFDDRGLWLEPVEYETPGDDEVVAFYYFAEGAGRSARPSLEHNYLLLPGISEGSSLSPLITKDMHFKAVSWLGHGAAAGSHLTQQWGLPAHYYAGFHRSGAGINIKGAMKEHLSDAFSCGLAELPAGDFFLDTDSGRHSLFVSYRSDLWKHLHGPGKVELGARLYWSVGPNYYEAIRSYYLGLASAGVIAKKENTPAKNSVVLSPQFNTWGAEVAADRGYTSFDQEMLESIYNDMQAAGMKAKTFVIDAKWEGQYGRLQHDDKRFPHFDAFLSRIRSEGHRLGMWAAFLRCENPGELGLGPEHMLQGVDGEPIAKRELPSRYYLFDVTQPEVGRVLRGLAKQFIRRYNPDLVKFDFGYELPALASGRPKDMNWAGEKLLLKGLDVVVKAMREEKPDLAVMYYSLSPLFIDYFDLHSPDDMFLCAGEYDLEANRRFFFSSLLGEIGMPTYGSGGYDWPTMPSIWFDSAAVGTLGSLNSFSGDEVDAFPQPLWVAKYNGLSAVLRPNNIFSIEPIGAEYVGPTRAARTSSWARREGNEVVLVALRKEGLTGTPGQKKYGDWIEATASVVISSKTEEGIQRASKLGIVPFGNGTATIQRQDAPVRADVTEHLFGGKAQKYQMPVQGRSLRVEYHEQNAAGRPVEWIEIDLT